MLKDFFRNLLVDEDDFVEEDEEEVAEEIKPTPIMHQQQAAPLSEEELAPLFVEPEIEVAAPAEEKPAFKGIDVSELDDVSAKKKSSSNTAYRYDRKKLSRSKPVRSSEPAFYQAVISPIFGNLEESDKEFDKVHNAIDLPKPVDAELNIQVISPMYGSDIETSKPVSSIPAYTVPAGKRTAKTASKVGHVSSLALSEVMEEEPERESLFTEGDKK